MKHAVTIGVVCLARKTFDFVAAKELFDKTKVDLMRIKNINWEIVPDLVIEAEDAQNATDYLKTKNIDALVLISGTFHLGHLALILDKGLRKPTLLWAYNELPYDGGKIRLNSVCGLNLNASNLYKAGKDDVSAIVSDTIDEEWIDAIRMKASLNNAHFGIVGYHAHGFFNVGIDELSVFKETGMMLDHYEISDMYGADVTEEEISSSEKEVRDIFECSGVTDEQVKKVARLVKSSEQFIGKNNLDAIAVRCWPEFAASYGISPCAAMSMLQNSGHITACEGDIEAAMSMYVCSAIGAETPFLADLSQVNLEEDYALMWHCGVAPYGLWDGKCVRSLDTYFAGGKGVTADFVLKSGEVTIIRIDSARGKTRVFLQKGEALPMEKSLRGTYAKVRFNRNIKDLLEIVAATGVAHHVAMVYGDYISIFKKYAKLQGFEIIE